MVFSVDGTVGAIVDAKIDVDYLGVVFYIDVGDYLHVIVYIDAGGYLGVVV